MKRIGILSLIMTAMVLVGCSSQEASDQRIAFDVPVEIILENDVYTFIFEDEAFNEKYLLFKEELQGVDLDHVASITTSTANMLYAMGITPIGISSSSQLHPDLYARRANSHLGIVNIMGLPKVEDLEGGIQVIGDGTSTNNEILVTLNPSRTFYSSALPNNHDGQGEGISSLMNTSAIHQSNFEDPFITIQSFRDLAKEQNRQDIVEKINAVMEEMALNIETARQMVKKYEGDRSKTVAVVQVTMGDELFIMNKNSAAGIIAQSLGLNNVFGDQAQNLSLSIEALIEKDPDYILIVGMGVGDDARYKMEAHMRDSLSKYRSLKAVINKQVIVSDMSPSLDFKIGHHIREIAGQVYGEK